MVPVLDQNNNPLFPCKERRARCLIKRKEAIKYWQKGIFCIKLTRKETDKREEYSAIVASCDSGSKREGYTVATEKAVILNITTNTPHWVKDKVETRRNLRRSRRNRKTPYRKCRSNRSALSKKGRIPPSTKARWDAKLRIIKSLLKIIPISVINIEDINARTLKGNNKKKWNQSFSPLEVGKNWFYNEVKKLGIKLILTQGTQTSATRKLRGFEKSKDKLDYTWEAHNSDSHILCEIALNKQVKEFKGIWKIEFMEFSRRQLQVQCPAKGGMRKKYGSTISLGMSRGSFLEYKGKFYSLGGTSKNRVSIHSIITGNRVKQFVDPKNIQILHRGKRRVQFIPRLKPWASLRKFG